MAYNGSPPAISPQPMVTLRGDYFNNHAPVSMTPEQFVYLRQIAQVLMGTGNRAPAVDASGVGISGAERDRSLPTVPGSPGVPIPRRTG